MRVTVIQLFGLLFRTPVDEVAGVEGDAEKIGGDKSELGGADSDHADDGAVHGGDDPALPELLADEHCGENGQNARQIIKPDYMEHIQHVGSVRQGQDLKHAGASYGCDLPPYKVAKPGAGV